MRNRLRYILFLGVAAMVFGLSSCVTSRKVNYMQEPDKRIPSYADTLSFEDYQLRVNDRLYIYVYSLDEKITALYNSGMSSQNMRQQMRSSSMYGSNELYTYLVDDEGNIDFPTLGKVQVLGLTTREVKR